MKKENMSKVAEAIENYTELDNSIKVYRFKKSKVGDAMLNTMDSIGISTKGQREIVLTNKNSVIALLLNSSDINDKRLFDNTEKEITESKQNLAEIQNQ